VAHLILDAREQTVWLKQNPPRNSFEAMAETAAHLTDER
jgi:hypothetical protein